MKRDTIKVYVLGLLTMSFLVYSGYLYLDAPRVKQVKDSSLVAEGKIIWQQKNCTSCHQIYGLGGHLGPDLTNVISKQPHDYIEAFIKNGSDVMPNFNLSDHQVEALVAFLTAVNKSGNADPRTYKLHYDGTLSQ